LFDADQEQQTKLEEVHWCLLMWKRWVANEGAGFPGSEQKIEHEPCLWESEKFCREHKGKKARWRERDTALNRCKALEAKNRFPTGHRESIKPQLHMEQQQQEHTQLQLARLCMG